MKRNKRNLFLFGASILVCGALLSTGAYAERFYITEEPTVTIDQEAKTATVKIIVQNLDTGITDYDVSYTTINGDGTMISHFSTGARQCAMGTISCEQQMIKPLTIVITERDLDPEATYSIGSISFKDTKNASFNISGGIEYTLEDGIISNTYPVQPPADEKLENTFIVGEPEIEYDDNDEATVSITLKNEVNGIKSAHYYLNSSHSGVSGVATVRKDITRDCTGLTEEQCAALDKTPLTITFTPDDYDLEPILRSLVIEYSDGSMIEVGGSFRLSDSDAGFDNALTLTQTAATPTATNSDGSVKNPQTADPIVGLAAIIGAATLVGVFGLKRQARR